MFVVVDLVTRERQRIWPLLLCPLNFDDQRVATCSGRVAFDDSHVLVYWLIFFFWGGCLLPCQFVCDLLLMRLGRTEKFGVLVAARGQWISKWRLITFFLLQPRRDL